jgi:hypothetical protein
MPSLRETRHADPRAVLARCMELESAGVRGHQFRWQRKRERPTIGRHARCSSKSTARRLRAAASALESERCSTRYGCAMAGAR